ncbi:MAG: CU044_2847 family protein [Cyanobacteria bacterium P01_H01_bin.119]
MSEIQRLLVADEAGNEFTFLVESKETTDIPLAPQPADDDDDETYGLSDEMKAKLKDIHGTIQAYAYYAIGAFKKVAFADVEEMTLKFGIKIAGKAGLPILTEGSAEGNFEIEVKCKFKD